MSLSNIHTIFSLLSSPTVSTIQILSLESIHTISTLLNLPYTFTSTFTSSTQPIIFLIDDGSTLPSNHKIILYSRNLYTDFIKIPIHITTEDKMHLKMVNIPNPLHKLSQITKEWKLRFNVSYEEFVVIVVVRNNKRVKKIMEECVKIDDGMGNKTKVMMILNRLEERGVVKRKGGIYRVNVDEESLREIKEKYGCTSW